MAKKKFNDAMLAIIVSMVSMLGQDKSDEEIIEASICDKVGDEECTEELLGNLLVEAKARFEGLKEAESNAGKFFGNKDKNKEYPLPELWKDSVVIRESLETKVGSKSSDVVEIPSSVRVNPYDPSLFDMHVKSGMFKGKRVKILHDPRK